MKNKKIIIIIPAYNESENISDVVVSLKKTNPEWDLLVVNDCSKDETSKIANSCGYAKVIDLACNLGIGGSVQTGLIYAARADYDIAIKFDGDGQHKASEITKLIEPVLHGKADVCIGSRFCRKHDGFSSTFARKIGIKIFELINSSLIGQRITDNTSGFRAYNRKAIEFLAEFYPAFDYPEPEEVILLGKNSFRIQEVFTQMQARQGGESSISTHRSVYYMVKVITAVLMASLRRPVKR